MTEDPMTLRIRLVLSPCRPSMRQAAFLTWLLALQDRARQRYRLAELDERMLRDVGLTRAQAQLEAEKPFRRARLWE
jgi:uncharacterized protein YjiS (DUF1127 family)